MPWQNLDVSFYRLNESFRGMRQELGEDLYHKLMAMSDQMRAYFEADPEEMTGETRKGKDLVYEMEALLEARRDEVRGAKVTGHSKGRAAEKGCSKS
jgi:hypothetical protein